MGRKMEEDKIQDRPKQASQDNPHETDSERIKDREADQILTFAGTSSRTSQKLLVSEAVVRGWPTVTLDVRKAFLKGVTYKQLAEATGEPEREVNFEEK